MTKYIWDGGGLPQNFSSILCKSHKWPWR